MASTLLLRLTNLIQILNVLILPIVGLVAAAIVITIVETLTLGYADDSSVEDLANLFIYIFFGLALFYLIDTIGLAKKVNLFRFLSILVNLAIAGFIGYNTFTGDLGGDQFIVGIILMVIYLIPVLVLTFHKRTIQLFKE